MWLKDQALHVPAKGSCNAARVPCFTPEKEEKGETPKSTIKHRTEDTHARSNDTTAAFLQVCQVPHAPRPCGARCCMKATSSRDLIPVHSEVQHVLTSSGEHHTLHHRLPAPASIRHGKKYNNRWTAPIRAKCSSGISRTTRIHENRPFGILGGRNLQEPDACWLLINGGWA